MTYLEELANVRDADLHRIGGVLEARLDTGLRIALHHLGVWVQLLTIQAKNRMCVEHSEKIDFRSFPSPSQANFCVFSTLV